MNAPRQQTYSARETDFDVRDSRAVRSAIRAGKFDGYTAAMAPGNVQANICILPHEYAEDFLLYCQRNPAPCPLLARSDVGSPTLPELGEGIDVRTDVPRYNIFENGKMVEEVGDITDYWRNDLVTFAMGCSFSFEEALLAAGLPLRFLERNQVAGVYRTALTTQRAGMFEAPLIVTMRPFMPADAIRAIQITSRFPRVHGAPIHIGNPAQIGVDLEQRYRDIGSSDVEPGELPVFWACGLTPQLAIEHARIPFSITHAPSRMLVTDLKNAALSVF